VERVSVLEARGTASRKSCTPLGLMKNSLRTQGGRAGKPVATRYNGAYDASGLPLLSAAIERTHQATFEGLSTRRHLARTNQLKKIEDARLRCDGAREYRVQVEARECARAVRCIMGLRQSWRRWSISRKIICKEDRAVRDARRVKPRRRWSLPTFALACPEYQDGIEEALGCSEAAYIKAAAPATLRSYKAVGREEHAAHLEHVRDLHASKLDFLAQRGLELIAQQLTTSVDGIESAAG
jgi:hypothetical protein